MNTLLMMAGGTGGHLYPALAVAECLRTAGVRVVWLGTREGLESRVVPAVGFEMEFICARGLASTGLKAQLSSLLRLPVALWQVLRIARRRRASIFFGAGGFVSGPGGVAAYLLRCPLVIHESNAKPGLTNRMLKPIARRVLTGFPGVLGQGARVEVVGNPVRKEILAIHAPDERLTGRTGALRVLVLGGSRGARIFNELIPEAMSMVPAHAVHVRHQCGPGNAESVRRAYQKHATESTESAPESAARTAVSDFIDDMAAAYSWADVAICRAGAMTVSELAATGLASLLVPFPFATGAHQDANADVLVGAGAAIKVPQSECSAAKLAALVRAFIADRASLLTMAHRARAVAKPAATQRIADICLEVMHA